MTDRLLTVSEVADVLSVSRATVYGLVSREAIPYLRINGAIRFPVEAIRTWIERNTIEAKVVPDRRSTYRVRRKVAAG